MKNKYSLIFLFCSLIVLPGCQAIGDIFKTGVWFGVIIVLGIIGLIIYFVTKSKN